MYADRAVAVVVPAHDEAAFVGDVVAAMPSFVDRVYVVDDASSDATYDVALDAADRGSGVEGTIEQGAHGDVGRETSERALADRVVESTRRGRVFALRHGENRGAGGAVKTGYLAALAGDADLVATVDADGQMDPSHLDRYLDPLVAGAADYATGTRLERREDRAGMPGFRLFGNAVLTALARVATGYWSLTDPVNGYTAVTRDALEALRLRTLYEGYGYGIQVLARLHAAGCRVRDVPTESTYGDEESGIDYASYVPRVSGLLAATFCRRLRREHLSDQRPQDQKQDQRRSDGDPLLERGWRE